MSSPLGLTNIPTPIKYEGYVPRDTSNNISEAAKSGISSGVTANTTASDSAVKSILNDNSYYVFGYNTSRNGTFNDIHKNIGNSDIYDISTNSIIEYCNQYPTMKLKMSYFAYLKNQGVFPNNRLMIARRFASPVVDDLTSYKTSSKQEPISTLITWYEGEKSPLKISFGERWVNGQGDIVTLLDEMFNTKSLSGGLSAVDSFFKKGFPAPGFSEGIQFQILSAMGVTSASLDNIPSGNPNLIQESRRRDLVGSNGGSGLESNIVIPFETEYIQDFIYGNDPTLAYLDIIQNVLRFGSSRSQFYINGRGSEAFNKFFDHFKNGEWLDAIVVVIDAVVVGIQNIVSNLLEKVTDIKKNFGFGNENQTKSNSKLSGMIQEALGILGGAMISKYRVQLSGVISALAGTASTPWHITIGNPKSPIFSSGDMLVKRVTLELGDTLAFNDLPTSIKISFDMECARSLGIQEIFAKMNNGSGRNRDLPWVEGGGLRRDFFENPTTVNDNALNSVNESKRDEINSATNGLPTNTTSASAAEVTNQSSTTNNNNN